MDSEGNFTTTNIVEIKGVGKPTNNVKEDWRDKFKLNGKGKSRSPKRVPEGDRRVGVTPRENGGYMVRFKKNGYDFYYGIYNNLEDANRVCKYGRHIVNDLIEKGLLVLEKDSK